MGWLPKVLSIVMAQTQCVETSVSEPHSVGKLLRVALVKVTTKAFSFMAAAD
jgi:hypothetical protein